MNIYPIFLGIFFLRESDSIACIRCKGNKEVVATNTACENEISLLQYHAEAIQHVMLTYSLTGNNQFLELAIAWLNEFNKTFQYRKSSHLIVFSVVQ